MLKYKESFFIMQTQNDLLREKYINPVWLNTEKTSMEVLEVVKIGKVHREQNVIVQKWNDSEQKEENVVFNTIMNIYSMEEIDEFTKKLNEDEKDKLIKETEEKKIQEETARLQKLFQTKLDIFNISLIKESDDKVLKPLIRKSKSEAEAIALATMLMMKEMNIDSEND